MTFHATADIIYSGVKHSKYVMFLWLLALIVADVSILSGQTSPPKLASDQPGCVDSKFFPKLLSCRIDNCEKKDADHRDVIAGEDEQGEAVSVAMDGSSRSVMYECEEGTTPAAVVGQAASALKLAGFEIPYRFADAEASLTARKDDLWVIVEAASRFYTLTEFHLVPPDYDSVTDAASMADMIERYGHVPVFGIQFPPAKAELTLDSATILKEVLAMMSDHPSWRFRVESHTDNFGTRAGNMGLSSRRAAAVVLWLTNEGIKRKRLDPQGLGDTKPIAPNTSEAGRARNTRIELVKIPTLAGQ